MRSLHLKSPIDVFTGIAIRVAAAAMFWALLAGCAPTEARFAEQRLYAMGTWVDLALEAPTSAEAVAALEEIETMLRRFEVDYYAWADDGELARLNEELSEGRTVEVSPELEGLLLQSQRLSALSEGAFDPAVGGLVELWGFQSAPPPGAQPPEPEAIEAWRKSSAPIGTLTIENLKVTPGTAQVKLDLGGIAKGEAVDRAADLLSRRGIRNALVNAGGDLRVMGRKGDRAWRVGIESPREEGLLGIIELGDGEAAFTSGDYERFFEGNGKRMHHILDPRSGYPVSDTQSVTVIARNGVEADASATAIFVAGRDRWRRIAKALGIDMVLRVDASGEVEVTEKMRARLVAPGSERADVNLIEP